MEIREGGCECRDIRYALEGDPLALAACHCGQCQRQSGSAFSMSMVVPRDNLRITAGTPLCYETTADSGARKQCFICGRCGVRIYNALSSLPVTYNLKPGTLDDTSGFQPNFHVWVSNKQAWTPIPEGAQCFERNPAGLKKGP